MAGDLGEWRPYTVDHVASLMAEVTDDWWLSGGEALDRFVGWRTRGHGDIDVSVPTATFDVVAGRLAERFDVRIASRGRLHPIADAGTIEEAHNLWVREPGGGPWRWQVNVEPCGAATWTYRRDPRVTRARGRAIVTLDGLPCTAPAVQLLWKSANPTEKDELDRDAVTPLLPAAECTWLADAIVLAHPDSPWCRS